MIRRLFIGVMLVAALVVGYAVFAPIPSGPQLPLAGASGSMTGNAPDFALASADGSTVRLSDYRGKVVLLDFWATWCGGCKVEIPWFIEFEDAYKDRGFAALGVSLDEGGWGVVQPFLERHKVNYPVVLADEEVLVEYAVSALPKTLLIDRDGRIVASYTGVADKSELEAEIEALLQ